MPANQPDDAHEKSLEKEDKGRFSPQDKIRLLEPPLERTRSGFLKAASNQALTFFGATLVIVGEAQEAGV